MPSDAQAPVKLSLPLEFQQDIFKELREEDELVLLARGLGLLRIVTNLLHSYDAAGNNLILLVGADEHENVWIGEALAEHAAVSNAPKCRGLSLVNTDLMSVGTREKMYAQGGIFSITSRILIVDFLSGLLNPETVTGIVALHAERVVATSLEAFILRIYRQKNKAGFLKAFSDTPEPFTTGFAPLTNMMKNLFLQKPALYPRFHVSVANSLEGRKKAEVIELEVPMTEAMQDIQNAVLSCVEASISELKKANPGLEVEDWTVDSALHKNFDQIIRRQLDPVWHRTTFKTRQVVRDLSLLRTILHALLTYDAVNFNKYLDTVLAASQPPPGTTKQNQSPWLFLDAADTIFTTAKRRVYTGKLSNAELANSSNVVPESLQPVLEEFPKWAQLADILQEIEQDAYFNPTPQDTSNGSILIMCGDQGTCSQLREYLQTMYVKPEGASNEDDGDEDDEPSARFMMRRKLRNYLTWKRDFSKVSTALFSENRKAINNSTDRNVQSGMRQVTGKPPPNKRRRIRGGSALAGPSRSDMGAVRTAGDRDAHIASLMAELEPTEIEAAQKPGDVGFDPLHNMEDYYELFGMDSLIIVHPYFGDLDEHILDETKPRYVIMYEPDAAFIRRIEVYRSSHTDRTVKVFFMYYGGSVEEQRYLSAVRREKDAFTRLIKERANMALTLNTNANLAPEESFLRTINTRIAGGGRLAATAEPPRVVVDVREFRSSLPSLLHGRSIVIVPCMLTVGDYVLTPHICVERKSVRDLIGSFANGRLYNQAESMMEHYKHPMLLIEFDQNKSFTLEPFTDFSAGATSASGLAAAPDLQGKLVMLTLAFPRLRIIWSSSPYQTAEIFSELKKQQDEPDPLKAVQMGLDPNQMGDEMRSFNQTSQDMLRALPGVNESVVTTLMLKTESIEELANMDEKEVCALIGTDVGRRVHRFFNRSVYEEVQLPTFT
ncbi:DNA repair protein-like protein RAD1 [Cucurbitaria berberidis CBS 394.84]|uniref:DNA repair protein-like protein RAD1 n=1 Tax=Cucurbitaria berberidis CBS 394.84 TaxID=1168544 RepID=A0A9P4GW24_9PLEO|nr:DNA repair protein-like protein RAD1 [Cucurbitaria berberidis CBS 394.84]KAF1852071.1 DNA repair protein-like protein RAD1 [Cucurbitaria berberidis CBS 394.84]